MVDANVHFLFTVLFFLVLCSAFFSSAETGMMSLNRYRLRHLLRKGVPAAKRVTLLLERTDRLLSLILIGNTFANILASSVATIIAAHYFGDVGVFLCTILLAMVVLIFGETAPKTLAALYPMRLAFIVSLPLQILLKIMYPLVFLVNSVSNATLKLFRVKMRKHGLEPLTAEELRTVVHEASGKISANYQKMLLRILDLEHVTVSDVMVPRSEVHGIDLQDDWDLIVKQLAECQHAFLPIYRENLDRVQGLLNLRKVLTAMQEGELSKTKLQRLADEVYFVPENAELNKQLLNFQHQQKSIALVVDEYGDIQGLVTLQDVLEEIVGEFAKGMDDSAELVCLQKDGSYLVDGGISMRDLTRLTHWEFPINGPKTLSGLIIEYLEMIPEPGVGVRVAGYPMEILEMADNRVKQVRVIPKLHRHGRQRSV